MISSAQRRESAAYQADGAKAATARYVQSARREVLTAQQRTERSRSERKRQEREGLSHAQPPKGQAPETPVSWLAVADLSEDDWLKWRK